MFEIIRRVENGPILLQPTVFNDHRGTFVKPFHNEALHSIGISLDIREEIISVSKIHVLRGMHFQVPPHDHQKFIYCASGRILDVVVDIRKKSPGYRKCFSAELSDANRNILLVPKGFAHGFLSLQENSTVVYKTDAVYAPDYDMNIRWNSIGFDWPTEKPLLSHRDEVAQALADFDSPF